MFCMVEKPKKHWRSKKYLSNSVPKKAEEKKEVLSTIADTKKITTEWQLLAEEGGARAQYNLASMCKKVEGLSTDFVSAHM